MKNNFVFGIILLLLVSITSCTKKNPDLKLVPITSYTNKNKDLKFYSCEFDSSGSIDSIYFSKWVDNKEEAFKTKLIFNSSLDKRNLDSLLQNKN
jgi:predicted small lipoprotein YifL